MRNLTGTIDVYVCLSKHAWRQFWERSVMKLAVMIPARALGLLAKCYVSELIQLILQAVDSGL